MSPASRPQAPAEGRRRLEPTWLLGGCALACALACVREPTEPPARPPPPVATAPSPPPAPAVAAHDAADPAAAKPPAARVTARKTSSTIPTPAIAGTNTSPITPPPNRQPPANPTSPAPVAKIPSPAPVAKIPSPAPAQPASPTPASPPPAPNTPAPPQVQAKQITGKAAAGKPPTAAVITGTVTGTTTDPAPPPAKSPAAIQAKAAGAAMVVEAEQIIKDEKGGKDAGPAGPDYLGAPRRPRTSARAEAAPEPPPPTKAIPGGPLAIAGSKVDFESRRVERFLAEGGAALDGRVLDADADRPVVDAQIEAWMGTKSIHADTDTTGAFHLEGMVPGSRVTLWITATARYVQERIEVAIPSERPRLDLTFKLLPRSAASGHSGGIGVFLSRRAGRTIISGLDAFGPAERAGLAINDAIVAIGKRTTAELGPGAIEYLLRGTIGEDVEVTIAPPGGQPRKVTLKRAGR